MFQTHKITLKFFLKDVETLQHQVNEPWQKKYFYRAIYLETVLILSTKTINLLVNLQLLMKSANSKRAEQISLAHYDRWIKQTATYGSFLKALTKILCNTVNNHCYDITESVETV